MSNKISKNRKSQNQKNHKVPMPPLVRSDVYHEAKRQNEKFSAEISDYWMNYFEQECMQLAEKRYKKKYEADKELMENVLTEVLVMLFIYAGRFHMGYGERAINRMLTGFKEAQEFLNEFGPKELCRYTLDKFDGITWQFDWSQMENLPGFEVWVELNHNSDKYHEEKKRGKEDE